MCSACAANDARIQLRNNWPSSLAVCRSVITCTTFSAPTFTVAAQIYAASFVLPEESTKFRFVTPAGVTSRKFNSGRRWASDQPSLTIIHTNAAQFFGMKIIYVTTDGCVFLIEKRCANRIVRWTLIGWTVLTYFAAHLSKVLVHDIEANASAMAHAHHSFIDFVFLQLIAYRSHFRLLWVA